MPYANVLWMSIGGTLDLQKTSREHPMDEYIGKCGIALGSPDIPYMTSAERPVEVIVLYGVERPYKMLFTL